MTSNKVNAIYMAVAPITEVKCARPIGTASGFFYTFQDEFYFVTNRHVVLYEEDGHNPDALILKLHTDHSDLRKNGEFRVELYDGTKRRWNEHPNWQTENIDIVCIRLDKEKLSAFAISALSSTNFLPPDVQLELANDVVVMGYPHGFSDEVFNLPIVRNATIASVYGVPFQGKQFFLIDGKLHPGTSGSPVLTKPSNFDHTSTEFAMGSSPRMYFLGVHSATISVQRGELKIDLDLAAVWYASLIDEILQHGSPKTGPAS